MKRIGRGEIADPLRRGFGVFKAQGKSAILPWVIEHVAAVRSEGDGQPQLLCGLDKGARLVSRGRGVPRADDLFTLDHSFCERATTMRARILDRIVASAHIEDSDATPTGFYELPSLQILKLCSATHFHELSHGSSPPVRNSGC